MKLLLTISLTVGLALSELTPQAEAQAQYQSQTLLSIQSTNLPTATTNVAAINGGTNHVTLTKWDSFLLEVKVGITNPTTTGIDLSWESSADGVNWGNVPGTFGFFNVPLTNASTNCVWWTNITVNNLGYWRVGWLTNTSGRHFTNAVIKAWKKPSRQG